MSPHKKAEQELAAAGFVLKRRGAGHDIYHLPGSSGIIPLKRHDFNENDLAYIRKEIDQIKEGA